MTTATLRLCRQSTLRSRAARGDATAFAAVYERHHQALYRYCRSILRHEEDAQDALQSTMARAFAALQDEQREFDLKPWLFRIAHNEAISILRKRRATTELDDIPVTQELDDQVSEREQLRLLAMDLADLPDRQRAALVLRELNGLSHAEIAVVLELSAANVKQTIYEARTALFSAREGREMPCDDVRKLLSDGDGRVVRGRGIRAHLRTCAGCRRFQADIDQRSKRLALLAPPLPTAGAAALLAEIIGGGGAKLLACVALAGGGGATVAAVEFYKPPPRVVAVAEAPQREREAPKRTEQRTPAATPVPAVGTAPPATTAVRPPVKPGERTRMVLAEVPGATRRERDKLTPSPTPGQTPAAVLPQTIPTPAPTPSPQSTGRPWPASDDRRGQPETRTQTPGQRDTPASAEQPSETAQPDQTQNPKSGSATRPGSTESAESGKPGKSAQPEETQPPVETQQPTGKPGKSAQPEETPASRGKPGKAARHDEQSPAKPGRRGSGKHRSRHQPAPTATASPEPPRRQRRGDRSRQPAPTATPTASPERQRRGDRSRQQAPPAATATPTASPEHQGRGDGDRRSWPRDKPERGDDE